jgi:CheY-like chemotaxis protein
MPSSNPEPAARRPYILVAEDNEVNRMFFSQIFEAAGLDFILVSNGEEAVAAWQRETPLVVLMDTAMPVLDGFGATARIRAIEAASGGHTPIIGVIAHMQESERELCLSSGMDDYVIKPVTPERLEDKIRQWLGEDVISIAGKQDHV